MTQTGQLPLKILYQISGLTAPGWSCFQPVNGLVIKSAKVKHSGQNPV